MTKPRKKVPYHIYLHSQKRLIPIPGPVHPVELEEGVTVVIHKDLKQDGTVRGKKWVITEKLSGANVTSYQTFDTIRAAKLWLDRMRSDILDRIRSGARESFIQNYHRKNPDA